MRQMWYLWHGLRLPQGREARRFVALIALAVGLSRAFLLPLVAAANAGPVQVISSPTYGVLFLALGVGLLATMRRRMQWAGRGVAITGMMLFGVLAYDVWPIVHTMVIYGLCVGVLLSEVDPV